MFTRLCLITVFCAATTTVHLFGAVGSERDANAAMLAAQGKSPDMKKSTAPETLPDLLKGELIPVPEEGDPITWNIGQTGMIGIKNGGFEGTQVRIVEVLKGTPADGLVLPGDVLLGVEGKDFVPAGHLGIAVGNALIKAEEAASKGKLQLHIWRDLNWDARFGSKNMFNINIEELFAEAENDETLYDWAAKDQKAATMHDEAYKKWPLKPEDLNLSLQLKTIGTYSDTSPFNCSVAETIRENAVKLIASKMNKLDRRKRKTGSWPEVLALVATGKPEYIAIAKEWVGSQKLEKDINLQIAFEDIGGGKQTWYNGFGPLEMAIYYDATGDKRVLPEIRKKAIWVALGQNGGGSWGHGFSSPNFNGGLLHRNNPGYGAMNNPSTRCFFLLTLAQKAGIKHPEIDAAIKRSERFFRTFVDKGAIPYGYHPPAGTDDSNGKNYGAAYAFYVLGLKYDAKYFSMCGAHASFTRRGGHGSPTLWYYSTLCQNIAGPKAITATHRNMRWFYTLARKYDGSFVFQGEQAGIGGKGMRYPTAHHALYYSYPLKQTIITGKDADPNFWMNDEELNELLVSASKKQIKEPALLKQAGKPIAQRSTDELIELMDHFYPVFRKSLAQEIAKRYQAGENDILGKVVAKMTSKEPRMRAGACEALGALGRDEVLANMTTVTGLLKDDWEFVRMHAAKTIGGATDPGNAEREVAILSAVVNDVEKRTKDNGNVSTTVRNILFPDKKKGARDAGGPISKLLTVPFEAGYDSNLVRAALERIVTMDPGGRTPETWNRKTLIEVAGHVVFSAEDLQMNDSMFAGTRKSQAQALLRKHQYREGYESDAANLKKHGRLSSDLRRTVAFKDAYVTPSKLTAAPVNYGPLLSDFYRLLQDKPNYLIEEKIGKIKIYTPLYILAEIIEKNSTGTLLPSISDDVGRNFRNRLDAASGSKEKLALCRKELDGLDRKNTFRKIHAMTALQEMLGPESLADVAPYIGHIEPRLDEHARQIVHSLVQQGQGTQLMALYQSAKDRDTGIHANMNAAMMLQVLADAGHKPALETIRAALSHKDSMVRKQAVQALFKLGGDAELKPVFQTLMKSTDPDELYGCEAALLSRRDDPTHVQRCSNAARKLLPGMKPPVRRALAYVLGQFGGPENLAALKQAAITHKGDDDLKNIIVGLVYSPDRSADQVVIELLKEDEAIRLAAASLSVHRMVGPNGMNDSTDEERIDFAEGVLKLQRDPELIMFLGKVHNARSVRLLFGIMKNGKENTSTAVSSIIACAEGISKPSAKDSESVSDVLTEVVEYIEVSHLRGGYKEHVKSPGDATVYTEWRAMQARAGSTLLKFNKPKKKAIPSFDDTDLDI